MTEREKVIKGLRHCTAWGGLHECQPKFGTDCPYEDEADCKLALMRDALLAILKEQEEKTTTFVYDEYTLPTCEKCGFHPFAGYIPTIKWMKERGYMKCPRCGRSVK